MLSEPAPAASQPAEPVSQAHPERCLSRDELKILAAYRLLMSQGRPFNLHVQFNGCMTRIMKAVVLSTTAVVAVNGKT